MILVGHCVVAFLVSSRRRHTICALVTGVHTCALPIFLGYAELLRCQSSDSFLGFAIGHWVLHPGCERVAGSADIARLQQRVQPQDPECDPTASMANVDARGSAFSQPCSGDEFDTHVPVVTAE